MTDAGGEVRSYNPFRFSSPFGWINRDHRKLLMVDRDVAFVGGLCISAKWLGDERRHIAPWRDTAVAVRGPVVLAFEQAFADTWAQLGAPLPPATLPVPDDRGTTDVRVIATQPDTAGMFRLDQLIAALAQRSLWIADAYFVGLPPYLQALVAAARDGVDVRLLVPGASDLPVVRSMSRSGYRPLLEAGVRVFEWNGSMMHAKTAVADGRWARVGSSNLNIASWIGNCELDVTVEDTDFAGRMEEQYLQDLARSTEIVLPRGATACGRTAGAGAREPVRLAPSGSAGRAAAGALSVGSAVGAALTNRRLLGPAESGLLSKLAILALASAGTALVWPRVLTIPLAIAAAWLGLAMLGKAWTLRRQRPGSAPGERGRCRRGRWRPERRECYESELRP